MKISKFVKWRTEDGTEHITREMAEQYIKNAELLEVLGFQPNVDAQDILNSLSGHRKLVREWIDACDTMEKASLR